MAITVGIQSIFLAQRLPRRCAEFSRLWLLALTVAVILGPVARRTWGDATWNKEKSGRNLWRNMENEKTW
jgi:hypothetical protein